MTESFRLLELQHGIFVKRFSGVLISKNAVSGDRLYRMFLGSPGTRAGAGMVLDAWIHAIFSRGGSWTLAELENSKPQAVKNNVWMSGDNEPTRYLTINANGFAIGTEPHLSNIPPSSIELVSYTRSTTRLVTAYYQSSSPTFFFLTVAPATCYFSKPSSPYHGVKKRGIQELMKLGAKTFTCIFVTVPEVVARLETDSAVALKIEARYQLRLAHIDPDAVGGNDVTIVSGG
jgi:hypothetical protein